MNTDDLVRAFIQNFHRFMEQQQVGEEALRRNNEAHAQHLVYLKQALHALEQNQPQECLKMVYAFYAVETARMRDRIRIWEGSQMKPVASPHAAREQALWQRLRQLI